MNPTIKARIESIRRGEVPAGYKRTKIGIVPNEWGNVLFSTLFESFSVYTEDLEKYPLYSLTIEEGITPKTERYERSFLVKKKNAYKVMRPNDFAYNPMNLRFGAVARYKGEKLISVSGYYDIFTTKSKLDLEFMDNFLIFDNMITYYNKVSIGSLIEKQRVHFSNFLNFELPLPPLTERNRIAEILAGQDRVIALKEKLLAEKQKQKKYLMQQLFMHDIKEWIRLSEIANVIMGQSPDSKYYNDKMIGLPLLQGNADLKDGYPLPRIYTTSVTKKCEKNDILLSVRAPVGCVFRSNIVACIGRGISAIRSREHQEYLYHFLIFYEEKWKSVAQGSTFEAISGNDIRNLLIPIVVDKEKVCKVLSTADKEIELLKKDIEQEKLKKKSLMQLLLTGIVRVDELVS